jgi:hypothetical protein
MGIQYSAIGFEFNVPENEDDELFCYAYGSAVCKALELNPSLGGIADRVAVIGKKYVEPKNAGYGEGWQLVITLRITVEGTIYVG